MVQIQETKEFSSDGGEKIQPQSDIHWADGYKHKPAEAEVAPGEWSAIIQSLIGNNADHGSGEGQPDMAARLIQASNLFVRLNEFWAEAIKDLPELYQSSGDVEKTGEIFESWVARFKSVFKKSTDEPLAAQAGEIFSSWAHILQMNQKANAPVWGPLMEAMPRWSDQSEKLAKGDLAAIDEGLKLWREVYGETLGRFLEMPGLGLTKQHTEKMSKTCAEFTQFASSLPYFYQYLFKTEMAALKEVFEQIRDLKINEATPEAIREIYKVWLATSEKRFHELFRRPDFCHTVSEVLNCMFRLKQQLNEMSAQWCEAMSIPSRRDHDHMAMAIQDLRRKVHAQQRTISALQEHLNAVKAGRDDDAAAV